MPALPANIDLRLSRLEPVVMLEGGVHAAATAPCQQEVAKLVTAAGQEHPLQRLVSLASWQRHLRRVHEPDVRSWLQVELECRQKSCDSLAGFVRLALRSRRVELHELPPAVDGAAAQALPDQTGLAAWIRDMPLPTLPPGPLLGMSGRYWMLGPAENAPGRFHVRFGDGTVLAPTGDYLREECLVKDWAARLRRLADEIFEPLDRVKLSPSEAETHDGLARSVRETGACRLGDLLYIAGPPPRLGHIMPPHYSTTLCRSINDDVALAIPLGSAPATLEGLVPFERGSNGAWRPLGVSNGICLGAGVPAAFPGPVAALRFAAIRIAKNGKFHERDGVSDDGYY